MKPVAAYLTVEEFKDLSVMPASDIDALETVALGWLDKQLTYWSAWIDSRLRKRYAAPFAVPVPIAVQGWLARIVTVKAYLRRGVNSNDEQFQEIKLDHDNAMAEIKEAADSENGLFDLPLREDTTSTGVSKGGPLSYSEQSPYVAFDLQRDTGRNEDSYGRGTGD